MDAALKARWVEALRSGKYRQARGYLREDGNCMCCLGVLCDVIDPLGWSRDASDDKWWDHTLQARKLEYLDTSKVPLEANAQKRLADMNDDGKSFSEIADEIEKLL